MHLDCAGKRLDLSRPVVMGILNVTPDSFSDGGKWSCVESAVEQGIRMAEEGAGVIDVGGESTRPGAGPVGVEEELARVIPVIEALAPRLAVPISIDTSKPEVMRAAVAAGAGLINDVYALRYPGALEAAAASNVPICLMHMQGEPRTMQHQPSYRDVVVEVAGFLAERMARCAEAGIARGRIVADPGFGFGKSPEHNLSLLKHLPELTGLGVPLLVGLSRKSTIGLLLDHAPPDRRLNGSIAAAVLAAWMGASIVRVHDVKATVEALKIVAAVRGAI